MPAYQIQVRGTLDGATAFALPDPIPAPSLGGVTKIDAGVAVNVGTFDANTLGLSEGTPIWLKALQVEFAALTRAARFTADVSGTRTPAQIVPDQVAAAAAPLMRRYSLAENVIMPVGTEIVLLTDDTDGTFSGAPVAGPHFVYLDFEPIRDDAQMALIQDLMSFANAKNGAQGEIMETFQAVAATLVTEIGLISPAIILGTPAMQVQSIELTNGAVAAAGESMVILVERVAVGTGTGTTLGTFTISAAVPAANSRTSIDVLQVINELNAGDRIRVTRTYVAGMAPTPVTNTTVRVKVVPNAF